MINLIRGRVWDYHYCQYQDERSLRRPPEGNLNNDWIKNQMIHPPPVLLLTLHSTAHLYHSWSRTTGPIRGYAPATWRTMLQRRKNMTSLWERFRAGLREEWWRWYTSLGGWEPDNLWKDAIFLQTSDDGWRWGRHRLLYASMKK